VDHLDVLSQFLERLHEHSPELFWTVVGIVSGLLILVVLWAIVTEALAKARRQQTEGAKANHRLSLWMKAGGLIALYVALIPVGLAVGIVIFLWEDYKLHFRSS
jgi:flagellar biosynthesis/type III secretory pathway M-ring protein FliF/YscJ